MNQQRQKMVERFGRSAVAAFERANPGRSLTVSNIRSYQKQRKQVAQAQARASGKNDPVSRYNTSKAQKASNAAGKSRNFQSGSAAARSGLLSYKVTRMRVNGKMETYHTIKRADGKIYTVLRGSKNDPVSNKKFVGQSGGGSSGKNIANYTPNAAPQNRGTNGQRDGLINQGKRGFENAPTWELRVTGVHANSGRPSQYTLYNQYGNAVASGANARTVTKVGTKSGALVKNGSASGG